MDLAVATKVLHYCSTAAEGVLAVRLYQLGLHRAYRFFFLYLVVQVLRSAALFPFRPNTKLYGDIYLISGTVILVLFVAIAIELYGVVLADRRGIASLGRWAIIIALGLSVGASLLFMAVDLSGTAGKSPILFYFNVVHRVVASTLLFFLLLITAFLLWFPVPLKRNAVVYCLGYAIYFLAVSSTVLLMNVAGVEFARIASVGQLAVATGCAVVWIFALNRQGESDKIVVGHQWSPEQAERLIGQLNSMNTVLLRTARR
jgi:hypothetical protein